MARRMDDGVTSLLAKVYCVMDSDFTCTVQRLPRRGNLVDLSSKIAGTDCVSGAKQLQTFDEELAENVYHLHETDIICCPACSHCPPQASGYVRHLDGHKYQL